MAIKKTTLTRIEKANKRFTNYLRYRAVGPHALNKEELKDLVRAGWITPETASATTVSQAYMLTHAKALDVPFVQAAQGAAKVLSSPKNVRDGAIDFLERMFDTYSKKAGDQLKADVMSTIESNLMSLFDRREGAKIYEALKDSDVHSKGLRNVLKQKIDNWETRWRTIARTELNRASNWGSMDAILSNNPEKGPEDITVYKIGPHDGATCEWCKKFWFLEDFKTPRVYRMAELMANGTNIGKKKAEWKPSVDSTHPNERHILHELKPGWGFDASGGITYVGKGHDEWKKQRGAT